MELNVIWLKSSNSKQHRDRAGFLQKHWFIDVLSIDANIKTSRKSENIINNTEINWADIDTYNNSHIMNDTFIVRRLSLPSNILNSKDNISIKMQKVPKIIYIWNYIKNFPIFSFVFFIASLVIFKLFLWNIWQLLFKILIWVDIIGMALSILYFWQRFVKYMLSLFTINYVMYDDIKVSFVENDDLNIISSSLILWFKNMFSDIDVSDILIYNNYIYIKQPNQIYPQNLIWLVDNLLTKRYKSDLQKTELISKTFSILSNTDMSSLFIKK